MISNKCPSIGKVGRTKTIVDLFQRFFGMENPLSKKGETIETPKPKNRALSNAGYHLTIKQVLKIINACSSKRNRILIQIFAYTGLRRAEVTALAIEDIGWDKNILIVRQGKGNRQRLVPIPKVILQEL